MLKIASMKIKAYGIGNRMAQRSKNGHLSATSQPPRTFVFLFLSQPKQLMNVHLSAPRVSVNGGRRNVATLQYENQIGSALSNLHNI
jgi:hypothetical protein